MLPERRGPNTYWPWNKRQASHLFTLEAPEPQALHGAPFLGWDPGPLQVCCCQHYPQQSHLGTQPFQALGREESALRKVSPRPWSSPLGPAYPTGLHPAQGKDKAQEGKGSAKALLPKIPTSSGAGWARAHSTVHTSIQLHIQQCHKGSLKQATAEKSRQRNWQMMLQLACFPTRGPVTRAPGLASHSLGLTKHSEAKALQLS